MVADKTVFFSLVMIIVVSSYTCFRCSGFPFWVIYCFHVFRNEGEGIFYIIVAIILHSYSPWPSHSSTSFKPSIVFDL